jgi:hypothetical protein
LIPDSVSDLYVMGVVLGALSTQQVSVQYVNNKELEAIEVDSKYISPAKLSASSFSIGSNVLVLHNDGEVGLATFKPSKVLYVGLASAWVKFSNGFEVECPFEELYPHPVKSTSESSRDKELSDKERNAISLVLSLYKKLESEALMLDEDYNALEECYISEIQSKTDLKQTIFEMRKQHLEDLKTIQNLKTSLLEEISKHSEQVKYVYKMLELAQQDINCKAQQIGQINQQIFELQNVIEIQKKAFQFKVSQLEADNFRLKSELHALRQTTSQQVYN